MNAEEFYQECQRPFVYRHIFSANGRRPVDHKKHGIKKRTLKNFLEWYKKLTNTGISKNTRKKIANKFNGFVFF